jgi:hypothetical protein
LAMLHIAYGNRVIFRRKRHDLPPQCGCQERPKAIRCPDRSVARRNRRLREL